MIRILSFLTGLAFLFIFADLLLSSKLKADPHFLNGDCHIWNQIINQQIDSDIYIYGSSRGRMHVNPRILMDAMDYSVYNFGIDGHKFELQNLRHQLLMSSQHKPKMIIYSLDYFTIMNDKDLYQRDQFLPYMWLNKPFRKALKKFNGFRRFDFYIPLIRYRGRTKAIKQAIFQKSNHGNFVEERVLGFSPKGITALDTTKLNRDRYEIDVDEENQNNFKEFVSSFAHSDVQLVLLYSPEYYLHFKQVKNRRKIINDYREIAEQYNIPFIDYSKHKFCRDHQLFFDVLHLNEKGTRIFTKDLAKKLNALSID